MTMSRARRRVWHVLSLIHSSLEYHWNCWISSAELGNYLHRKRMTVIRIKSTLLKAKDKPLGVEVVFLSLPVLDLLAKTPSDSCEEKMLTFGKSYSQPHWTSNSKCVFMLGVFYSCLFRDHVNITTSHQTLICTSFANWSMSGLRRFIQQATIAA